MRVRNSRFGGIAMVVVLTALSGCDAGDASTGADGSISPAQGSVKVYLHGRAEASIGAATR